MAEFRGAQGVPSDAAENAPSGEALYNQGMAHYRRREWRQAQENLRRLKAVEPQRRGVDTLLDELDIFIRLDSLDPATAERSAPLPKTGHTTAWHRSPWRAAAGIAALALVALLLFLFYWILSPRAARRIQELRGLAHSQRASGDWSRSIDTYEEWLLLAPGDAEAQSGLWTAYYERGDERAAAARSLEDQGQYAAAAGQWEGALADFRAAQQVDPGHRAAARGEAAARIQAADKARRCAALLDLAVGLHQGGRWAEAAQALEALRAEDAAYRSAEVAGYLCTALLERGRAALAAAASPAEIDAAVHLLNQAVAAQPGHEAAQAALRQARAYAQAVASAEAMQCDAAIAALEPLLDEQPDLAGGRARELLCRVQLQRAQEYGAAGRLRDALADYQAVAAGGCAQAAEAERRVSEIAVALTPTPAPTARPTPTTEHSPSPTPAVVP